MKYRLAVLCGLLFSFDGIAKDRDICPIGLTLFYSNGVLGTVNKTKESLLALKSELTKKTVDTELEGQIFYKPIFNPSNGILDFFEAVEQKLNVEETKMWLYISGVEPMPEELKKEFARIAQKRIEESNINQIVRSHVVKYTNELDQGRKIVVVAHSQGNFFANQSYYLIDADLQRSFGIVAVASPASYVPGGGLHTTITEDLVMASVPGSLEPNVNNFSGYNYGDYTGHGFVESYMHNGTEARNKIISDTLKTYERLYFDSEKHGTGGFSAILTWRDQDDVDLHVLEPSGTHVYYDNPKGQGTLDADLSNGTGPEKYYIACQDLQTGTYRVSVSYVIDLFKLPMEEDAFTKIETPNYSEAKGQSYCAECGSLSYRQPVRQFDIKVKGNKLKGFMYKVN